MGLFNRKKKENKAEASSTGNQNVGNVTLYVPGTDISNWKEELEKAVGQHTTGMEDEDGHTNVHLKDGTIFLVSIVENPEEVERQTIGMANFFSQAPMKDEKLKIACLQQIRLFTAIIGIQFGMNENEDRTRVLTSCYLEFAKQLQAFVLFPNMSLLHPEGKLLNSIEGKSDFKEYFPFADRRVVYEQKEEKQPDIDRKNRNIKKLKAQKIPYSEHLAVSVFDADCVIPSKEEIIHRLTACFAASVTSEVYGSGQFARPEEIAKEEMTKLEALYHFREYLSEEEREYIDHTPDDMTVHVKFGWRYEDCAILLWSLSLLELKKPTEICDAAELGAIIWNHDFRSLSEKAKLRSRDEIMDMQDLVFRYHWACLESRVKHFDVKKLNLEIVYEWHYALNWLTGFDGVKDWDEVSLRA